MQKRCTKCGIEKDKSEFRKNKILKNGSLQLCTYCKTCKRKLDKIYYDKNKIRIARDNKEYVRRKFLRYIKELHPIYIKRRLKSSGLNSATISQYPEIIELKRLELLTKRLLKKTIIYDNKHQ